MNPTVIAMRRPVTTLMMVVALIVEGRLNKQIAAQLGLSENTVKVHRHRIMERMAASSVVELARMLERLA